MAKKEKNAKRNIVFIFELSVIIAFFLFLLTGGLNGICKQLGAFFNSQQSTIKSIDKVNQSKSSDESKAEKDTTVLQLLPFQNQRQLAMAPLDHLRRATLSHIQLRGSDQPTEKREPRLNYNPSGWHNYNFVTSTGKKAWLNNRTHLVGYQFSGLNDQAENLVTATSYLNKGTVEAGMDDNNPKGMLYYENRLADWLHNHPNYYLDYAVKVSYRQDDLVPYELTRQYVGLDSDGKELQIKLGGRETYISNVTKVTLNNTSPNATIDYTTGTATQK